MRSKYGPWAVVTGASSGIGKAFALQLAKEGLNLVLVGRNQDGLDRTVAEVAGYGIETRIIRWDLASPDAADQLNEKTKDLEVGLLINAAGFGSSGPFIKQDVAEELSMLDVNCRSTLGLCFHFGRRFAANRRGGIVLLSSIVSFQGVPWTANYSATKAYVQNLAEALKVELAPHGVDVLSCAPGPVRTGFGKRAAMEFQQAIPPEEVAQAAMKVLGRRTTVVPGLFASLLRFGMAPLTRAARSKLMGTMMKKMAK